MRTETTKTRRTRPSSELELPDTTAAGEAYASEILRGEWDEDGTVSVYLPSELARKALIARGWTRKTSPSSGRFHSWTSPSGETYWETGDALQHALIAELA